MMEGIDDEVLDITPVKDMKVENEGLDSVFDEIEEDNLIYLRVLSSKINDGCFLHMEDF